MSNIESDTKIAKQIAALVASSGGRAYYVGGFVRDKLLNIENKDVDIEVHGITPDKLCEILDSLGQRIEVGESFGIYSLKGYGVDIAMPRREKVIGRGHRDFDVFVDPFIGTAKAAKRRDFTINSMMCDILTGEITDHFGGKEDLKKGILRHVDDESFAEDPLRVLRGAQFAARFNFTLAPKTVRLCETMRLDNLSPERVEGELKKALLKSEKPSIFFETLNSTNSLGFWFDEICELRHIMQSPEHHAEGDVYIHTMMVLDAAAKYRDKAKDKFGFMLSALIHDFGKVETAKEENGVIRFICHENVGIDSERKFLTRITSNKKLISYALNLSLMHMEPGIITKDKSSIKASNRMFYNSSDPEGLICLSLSDTEGKLPIEDTASLKSFLYKRLEIYNEYMVRDYVKGQDLLDAGVPPGQEFRELLDFALKLRLAGVSKENALTQTLAMARKNQKNKKHKKIDT